MLADIEVDHLVRNDSYALQREGLDASSWETLNDPALSLLFIHHNLFLNELDHDLIVNYDSNDKMLEALQKRVSLTKLEAVEALSDTVRVGSVGLDVLTEKLTSGDTLPLEVL